MASTPAPEQAAATAAPAESSTVPAPASDAGTGNPFVSSEGKQEDAGVTDTGDDSNGPEPEGIDLPLPDGS